MSKAKAVSSIALLVVGLLGTQIGRASAATAVGPEKRYCSDKMPGEAKRGETVISVSQHVEMNWPAGGPPPPGGTATYTQTLHTDHGRHLDPGRICVEPPDYQPHCISTRLSAISDHSVTFEAQLSVNPGESCSLYWSVKAIETRRPK